MIIPAAPNTHNATNLLSGAHRRGQHHRLVIVQHVSKSKTLHFSFTSNYGGQVLPFTNQNLVSHFFEFGVGLVSRK